MSGVPQTTTSSHWDNTNDRPTESAHISYLHALEYNISPGKPSNETAFWQNVTSKTPKKVQNGQHLALGYNTDKSLFHEVSSIPVVTGSSTEMTLTVLHPCIDLYAGIIKMIT